MEKTLDELTREYNEIISELKEDFERITKNTHRLSLRECYLESHLESCTNLHYRYADFEEVLGKKEEKRGVGKFHIINGVLYYQYSHKGTLLKIYK